MGLKVNAGLFLQLLIFCVANGTIHYYDFVLKEKQFTKLCSTKSMLTVNGSFPGPAIVLHRGDSVHVNVHNQGNYGVTIHWHGVKHPRNPWSDGPENITQCPIQPGKNFTYEIIFSNEVGTLWWHAHSDWSRATVHGPIIVLPAIGTTYPFPKPYAQQAIVIERRKGNYRRRSCEGGGADVSDAFTINGQPGDLYPCSKGSTFRLLVKYGKTYLLRIINAVMNEEHFFAIAGHKFTVVGQDGAYLKAITATYLVITPGQTIDVLVTANEVPSHYYMASRPFFDSFVPIDNTTTTAIFQYVGNYKLPSSVPFPALPSIRDHVAAANYVRRLRSLASRIYPVNVPKIIDQHLYITLALNLLPCPNSSCAGLHGDRLSASMNNVSFVSKNVDILQAYYRNLQKVFDRDISDEPPQYYNFTGYVRNTSLYTTTGTEVKMLNYGDTVEIVFQGTNIGSAENHPMHLHGFSFYLVGTGVGNFNSKTDPLSYNLFDPPEINTVAVPKNGWAAIRFFANNPGNGGPVREIELYRDVNFAGVWFVHCHLERHASIGMDPVLLVKNGNTKATSIRPPPATMPLCS